MRHARDANIMPPGINAGNDYTSRLEQNDGHFADESLNHIFIKEKGLQFDSIFT